MPHTAFAACKTRHRSASSRGYRQKTQKRLRPSCLPLVRVFYDVKGFFMGVVRAVLLELELRLGVFPEVQTSAMQALQAEGTGRVSTAYSLTEVFCVPDGTGQGCKLGPDRALFSLLLIQVSLNRLIVGHCFISRTGSYIDKGSIQSWFANNVTFYLKGAFQAQHSADIMDFFIWVNVDEVAVDAKSKKSSFAIAECQADTGLDSVGELYNIHLPQGDALPPSPPSKAPIVLRPEAHSVAHIVDPLCAKPRGR